jgi:uncharacterized protein YjbJ (UPF0337 family)
MTESIDTTKGKIKQAAGDLTGNDKLHREGKVDEMAGKAKNAVDDAIDKVKDKLTSDD